MATKKQAEPKKPPIDFKAEIIRRMSEGESLRAVCRTDGFPAASTVVDWTNEDEAFGAQYAHAREARADTYFDKLDDVSEEAAGAETAVEVAGLRLKADNIKWQLARMSKRYSDKSSMEVSGPDGGPIPSKTEVTFKIIRPGDANPAD